AARARLKLDEVPTKSTGAFDGDGGEVARRPFLTIRVTPCANRGPVGDAHRQRRLNPLKACHQFECKVALSMDIASEAARLRAARRRAGGSGRDDPPVRSFRTEPRAGRADRLMGLPNQVAEELRRIVGRAAVIDSANDLRIFERDGSIEGAMPDAVVLAST